jgi:acyl-CoA dehydrogenase
MGYIEETGAAQHLRDARITTIYEGTTGIQANDLIGRKIVRDRGQALYALLGEMRGVQEALSQVEGEDFDAIRTAYGAAIEALERAVEWLLAHYDDDVRAAAAGAVPMLKLLGIVAGGWQMARAALAAHQHLTAGEGDAAFLTAKIATARFFADHHLSQAPALCTAITRGGAATLALQEMQF